MISRQISTHKTLVTCQNQQKTFVCVWQSKIVRKKLNTWNSTPSHHKNTHGIFSSIVLLLYFAIFIISILFLFLISNTQLIHFSKAQLAASTWRSRFGRPTKVDPRVSEVVGGSYCKMPEDWLQKRIGMKKQTNKRKSFEKVLYFPHRHHIRRSCTLPFCLFSHTRRKYKYTHSISLVYLASIKRPPSTRSTLNLRSQAAAKTHRTRKFIRTTRIVADAININLNREKSENLKNHTSFNRSNCFSFFTHFYSLFTLHIRARSD